jgi:hypothetical protein
MTLGNIRTHLKPHNTAKGHRGTLIAVFLSLFVLMGLVASASAQGTVQISGIGYVDESGLCNDSPVDAQGDTPDFATVLDGDLAGCQYVFVDSWSCTPSGVYQEWGTEYYVVDGTYGEGTFRTTYFFKGKFEGCTAEGFPDGAEIFGFCQHPIVAGTGTNAYEGVTGRLHFQDDVEAGNFPYTGHLKW